MPYHRSFSKVLPQHQNYSEGCQWGVLWVEGLLISSLSTPLLLLSVLFLAGFFDIVWDNARCYLSVCLSVCMSVRLSIYLSICLSVCLSVCLSIYLSICLASTSWTQNIPLCQRPWPRTQIENHHCPAHVSLCANHLQQGCNDVSSLSARSQVPQLGCWAETPSTSRTETRCPFFTAIADTRDSEFSHAREIRIQARHDMAAQGAIECKIESLESSRGYGWAKGTDWCLAAKWATLFLNSGQRTKFALAYES